MPRCEFFEVCTFLNDRLGHMPQIAGLYRLQFCEGDSRSCARHMVMSRVGTEAAPKDLYPNQQERAEDIIAESRRAA